MKRLVLQVLKMIREKQFPAGKKFEMILIKSFIFTFVLLILIQVTMTFPQINELINVNSTFEGTPLGNVEYFYNEGEMVIELIGEQTNKNIYLLLNGEKKCCFDSKKIKIKVKDGDIVEVDSSEVLKEVNLRIAELSENVYNIILKKNFSLKTNVKKIAQLRVR